MLKKLLYASVALGLLASQADAAGTANAPIYTQVPNRGVVQFLQGTDSAGTYKTLYTAGSNGSQCYGMWMTSNDATSHLMTVQIVNSSVKYGGTSLATGTTLPGFATAVPPLSLTGAAVWTGLPVDANGNPYILLISGDTLQATFATALTSSDFINIVVTCWDF